jgi:TRAP-type C4-dicarboxylate transport system permease small subunit
MKLTHFIKKLSDIVDGITGKIVVVLIIAMIITITLQIITRIFTQALTWTEELSRYLLVWSTFLGSTLAYKRGLHISVTFVRDLFPRAIQRVIILLSTLVSLIFFFLAVWNGFNLISLQIFQVSPAIQIPMRWVYLGIPIGFSILIIHALSSALEELIPYRQEANP